MDDDRLNRRLLVWFSLGHLANDSAPCALWLIAPAIGIAMDLSPAEVGLLITISSVGAALGYLPAGILADRVARRGRLLLATFWWVAIGYAVASQAPGFWSVALLLAVAGLGDAAWHPIATGVLAQALPKRRAQALGIHAMGGSFAEVLAPLAVGFLLVHVDWRTALLLCALPAALMGLAFLRVSAAVPAARQGALAWADLWTLLQAWRSLRGLGMVAMIGVSNMAFMAILAMAPLLLQRVYGLSSAETGLVFSGMVLAGALSQPLVGRLSDGTGRKPLVVAGNLAAVAACLAVAVSAAPAATIPALIAAATALAAIRSVILVSAVEFAGQRESTTLGLAFVLLDGVGALGAVLAGVVGNLDLHYAFFLAAAFAAGAAALAIPIPFTAKRAAPAAAVDTAG
ncbi:MAG: MFS transporter [Rhodospirillales bacterium]|nr:MFS transporter [Rhodospirillales bacterium]